MQILSVTSCIFRFVSSAKGGSLPSSEGETHMNELRVPHILWIALFWSIVMMFVAENLLP